MVWSTDKTKIVPPCQLEILSQPMCALRLQLPYSMDLCDFATGVKHEEQEYITGPGLSSTSHTAK